MLVSQTYLQTPATFYNLQQQLQQEQVQHRQQLRQHEPSQNHGSIDLDNPIDIDIDLGLDVDLDTDAHNQSISSSPRSTLSLLSQYSAAQATQLSTFDSVPATAVPRKTPQGPHLFGHSQHPPSDDTPMLNTHDLMQSDSWLHGSHALTHKSSGRMAHHRESSLSSLGSAGPASPYSQNTSNPHIAVTDSTGDGYHGQGLFFDDGSYQLAKSINYDGYLANHAASAVPDVAAYSALSTTAAHQRSSGRGLQPPPELSIGSNRSRPVSVASSIASDSPATPSLDQAEEQRRRKNAFNGVPKLDRTMTDVYGDELYSPSFTITSASPSQTSGVPLSPNHDMFAQRLQAINSQHLSAAAHSPASTTSRGKSPFRHGSPLAPAASHDFRNMASSQVRFSTAQQLREQQHRADQDAQALRLQQQMGHSPDTSTPQTISPKDAILEFHEVDGEANFPLFPSSGQGGFSGDPMDKVIGSTASQGFGNGGGGGLPGAADTSSYNYVTAQLPAGLQVPQQYPFVAHPRQQGGSGTMNSAPLTAPSRVSSAGTSSSGSGFGGSPQRPTGAGAEGGTYTCTYHGCTQRFETPALLQKHKREGHRQAHGLNGSARRPDSTGMTSSLLNSQAGPHRCDRINPSTGKPCNTIFSRPYDLTRHEDTIHNARKQKVRCNLCTEEKTFSRADALTRHYRVCHPDVEFPGKHRRRGGHSG